MNGMEVQLVGEALQSINVALDERSLSLKLSGDYRFTIETVSGNYMNLGITEGKIEVEVY